MAEPHPFRRAAEAKDLELMTETLREDVVLHSPILFRGFEGRETVVAVLSQVTPVLEDFRYTDELAEGNTVVLRFKARVGDRELEGIDFLELDDDGKVADLTVFMRPLSAVTASTSRWPRGSRRRRPSRLPGGGFARPAVDPLENDAARTFRSDPQPVAGAEPGLLARTPRDRRLAFRPERDLCAWPVDGGGRIRTCVGIAGRFTVCSI